MKVDRYYRDLVALRRKSWKTISDRLGSLVDRMDRVNATLESSAAVPLAPLAAAVEMWRTLEKLCVASLANEPDKVKERRHHLCETVRRRIDLLDPTAVAASREPTIPDSPTDPARSHRAVGVGRAG
jgi:hypothetical protein